MLTKTIMAEVVTFKKPGRKGRPQGLRQKSPTASNNDSEQIEKSSVSNIKDRRSAVKAISDVNKQSTGKKRTQEERDNEELENDEISSGGVVDVNWSGSKSVDNTLNRNSAVVDLDAETIDGPQLKKYKEGDEIDPNDLEDDGIYRGLNSYTNHIKKKPPGAAMSDKFKAGPVRAPTNIRQITITDFQPDVCKDYKETGWCGFGDTCKFLHDRSDYMNGWQLDQAWNKMQAQKSGAAAFDSDEEEDSDDEEYPFACLITRQPFKDPIVTKCGHYFEKSAALKRFQKTPKCYACGAPTGGIFNKPQGLIKKLEERAAKEDAEAQEGESDDDNKIEGLEERNEESE